MTTPERCATCQRVPPAAEWFECSHVECPNRRPVTAQPGAGLLHDGWHNLTSHRPVKTSDEVVR